MEFPISVQLPWQAPVQINASRYTSLLDLKRSIEGKVGHAVIEFSLHFDVPSSRPPVPNTPPPPYKATYDALKTLGKNAPAAEMGLGHLLRFQFGLPGDATVRHVMNNLHKVDPQTDAHVFVRIQECCEKQHAAMQHKIDGLFEEIKNMSPEEVKHVFVPMHFAPAGGIFDSWGKKKAALQTHAEEEINASKKLHKKKGVVQKIADNIKRAKDAAMQAMRQGKQAFKNSWKQQPVPAIPPQ